MLLKGHCFIIMFIETYSIDADQLPPIKEKVRQDIVRRSDENFIRVESKRECTVKEKTPSKISNSYLVISILKTGFFFLKYISIIPLSYEKTVQFNNSYFLNELIHFHNQKYGFESKRPRLYLGPDYTFIIVSRHK